MNIITTTGLNLPDEYTEDEFFEIGISLSNTELILFWAIGDWYNAIPENYDNEEACKRAGLIYGTAKTNGWVAGKFDKSIRTVDRITFRSYRKLCVAGLTDTQRLELHDRAQQGKWTEAQVIKERAIIAPKLALTPLVGFDQKSKKLMNDVVDSFPKGTSKRISTKIIKGIKSLTDEIQKDLRNVVDHALTSVVEPERNRLNDLSREAETTKEYWENSLRQVNMIMTREEFNMILGCLHPDRNVHQNADKSFKVFKRLEAGIPKLSKKDKELCGWEGLR